MKEGIRAPGLQGAMCETKEGRVKKVQWEKDAQGREEAKSTGGKGGLP
jgi:hypothetical protein